MINELFDNFEVDIGLKQGQPDLTQGLLHIFFGEAALPAQVLERSLEFLGKVLKHRATTILTG